MRAFLLADLDIVEVLLELAGIDHRPDLGVLGNRVADLEVADPLGQRRDELVVDALGDDQARGRRAALAGRIEGALRRGLDRHLEVGVIEHDGRVLAAHFELELAHHLDAGFRHAAAGADRAGEGLRRDIAALEHGLADHRALAHHEVQHALGQPVAMEDFDDRPRAARHEVGRLEHHGVAVAERRRDLPGRDGDREVPRRDDADNANRFARHLDADARAHRRHALARQAQRLTGEELEDLPGAGGLANALGERLALFAAQQRPELFATRQDFMRGLGQDLPALQMPDRDQAGNAALAAAIASSVSCAVARA